MQRKLAVIIVSLYLLTVSIVAIVLLQASPGPKNQDLYGVGIGTYQSEQGIAYISGRRLQCRSLDQPAHYASQCSVSVAGKQLTLLARRNDASNPDQLGGICQAEYDGQTWPCHIGLRHVHTPWFAYLDIPLDLSAQQLDALRQRYWIENVPEAAFLTFIPISVVLSSVVAAVVATLWFWPTRHNKLAVLGIAGGFCLLAFISSGITALFITAGFWD
jgi:hypothetical protein